MENIHCCDVPFSFNRYESLAVFTAQWAAGLLAVHVDLIARYLDSMKTRLAPFDDRFVVTSAGLLGGAAVPCPYTWRIWRTRHQALDSLNGLRTISGRRVVLWFDSDVIDSSITDNSKTDIDSLNIDIQVED